MTTAHVYRIPSRTVPNRTYTVDLVAATCNCPAGGFRSRCDHLDEAARMERETMTHPELDTDAAIEEASRHIDAKGTRDAALWAALRAPFPANEINKLPRGGTMLDYVGHAAVTDRLLRCDPLWNWEPVAWGEDGLPRFTRDAQGRPVGLWIRLTVGGVTRLGYGNVAANASDAEKQLISDALRNAAMRFGVALDLWAKSDLPGGYDDDAYHAPSPVRQAGHHRPPAVGTWDDGDRPEFAQANGLLSASGTTLLAELMSQMGLRPVDVARHMKKTFSWEALVAEIGAGDPAEWFRAIKSADADRCGGKPFE